jgi:cysteinyl-tRNA synthetase
MDLFLYNTRARRKEIFKPIYTGKVGLYNCGPTVYNYAHIGNLRTYVFEDILKRVLIYNGLQVKHVMNITDVGHLTGDRDMGEDKMEKGALREGRTAWEIAAFYTTAFKEDLAHLNIIEPTIWCKATDTIPEQISLIETLEAKGYTYRTGDGIYFDTARFENYAQLSRQNRDALQEGARVEKNLEKRNPTDFALWKFSPEGVQRQMEWDSPWGTGFPGWHIECSAMSMKYLGAQLDIHCGGTDHIDVHHTNEIAQSEAATGSRFFNFWMHGEFLNIQGGKKMAKSEGNFLTLENAFVKNDIDPLVYRYATFHSHYRKPMEYSDDSIAAARNGLRNLRGQVARLVESASGEKSPIDDGFRVKFLSRLNDDLNMPQALAVVQALLKADLPGPVKLATIREFDAAVLGLELDREAVAEPLSREILELITLRKQARADKNWAASDRIRNEIQALGYVVQDGKAGMHVIKK